MHTLGCKLNQADSDALARSFVAAGYRIAGSEAAADVVVLNTCTVTATADSKARQLLRSSHRANPSAMIVATGCYAQRAAEELTRVDGVALVIGNTQKEELVARVDEALGVAKRWPPDGGLEPARPGGPETAVAPSGALRRRAMVKIQEGCNQVCAYCIVPKVRGRERSIPPDDLVQQIQERVSLGCQEVVLTGTQLGSYGFDLPGASLLTLLRRVLAETTVPRLRVSSLQPQEIEPGLLELWQDNRLCPHFHMALQSGSGRVLAAMRRRYTVAKFADTVELIRRTVPDAGITADLIVGFPGEGDAEFQESREFVRAMEFSDMHIFPFSPRPGTSANYLGDDVPPGMKKQRTAEMIGLAKEGFRGFRQQQLGKIRPVLWETERLVEGTPAWSGLTDSYIRVYTSSPEALYNQIIPARLLQLNGDWVSAETSSRAQIDPSR
ncbi:MAG: tRNA (N(6)-L-threonylcarbamoyladenosine(37)-C(2))-methylthiotransferase MtaB [SAR202 cluster bacterium Io17-Chloro-G9]|nr:MAG: tRNA (N(6)-L-threonylcarbamoyladenosine(37)-C(2))-methylthiotransferase MtaB [SAR202 cluster bacterium Io17-Chloro-G9]